MSKNIAIYGNSLIILVGTSGSGKSTFAHKNFSPSMVVSTDECRKIICGSALNQRVSEDAFDLFYFIIEKRLKNGYPTVADSTALKRKYRLRLLQIAENYNYEVVVIAFDVPLNVAIERDKRRRRCVGKEVIQKQRVAFEKTKDQLQQEKYSKVIFCKNSKETYIRFTHPKVEKCDLGPFNIISCLNGNYHAFVNLLSQLKDQQRKWIFLGNICFPNRENYETFSLVYKLWKQGHYYLPGSICHDLYLFFNEKKYSSISQLIINGLTAEQGAIFTEKFIEMYESSSPYMIFDDGNLIVSHGGVLGKWIGKLDKKIEEFCIRGNSGADWADGYKGNAHIVYSQCTKNSPKWKNKTINLGTTFSQLCVLQYPEKTIVKGHGKK